MADQKKFMHVGLEKKIRTRKKLEKKFLQALGERKTNSCNFMRNPSETY